MRGRAHAAGGPAHREVTLFGSVLVSAALIALVGLAIASVAILAMARAERRARQAGQHASAPLPRDPHREGSGQHRRSA